jgi:hypothetical protein
MVYSDIPGEASEKDVVWYRGIRADLDRAVLTRAQAVALKGLEPGEDVAYVVLPVAKCPGRCSLRGHCVQQAGSGPKCVCWQGYDGYSCELVSGAGEQGEGLGVAKGAFEGERCIAQALGCIQRKGQT